jgi:lipid-A-disaccharide synthase
VFLKKYGLSKEKTVIALLPGSRLIEIKMLLPIMIETAVLINKRLGGAQFLIAKHPDRPESIYKDAVSGSGLNVSIVSGDVYNLLASSDFAVVASGTATLESTIIGVPFVIIYKASLVTYIMYRIVRTTKYLGLVNVIAGREIVPELLQNNAKPDKISAAVVDMVKSPDKMRAMREYLKGITLSLGAQGANNRAARAILPLIKK